MTIARVAIDVPVDTLFDYLAGPAAVADIGRRVLVPFGRRQVVGVLLELVSAAQVPAARLRPVIRVFHDMPPLDSSLLRLLRFCARYYHHPFGAVMLGALPTRLRRTRSLADAAPTAYRLTLRGQELAQLSLTGRPSSKRRLFEALLVQDALPRDAIQELGTSARAALNALVEDGSVEPVSEVPSGTGGCFATEVSARFQLTVEQKSAVQTLLSESEGFRVWLVHGATGSGKTEVYLRAIADALGRRLQALLLVPEINLTPQLEELLRHRLPAARIASLHSRLAEVERARYWLAAQRGDADIVVGTRLAVFTPLPRLGLIVVDEEQDASFKQQEGLRYSARDMAIVRGKQLGIPVIIGSATPALETYAKALAGRYRALRLHDRPSGHFPVLRLVDTARDTLKEGVSATLQHAISDRLQQGEQCLVFLNRRGYAPVLFCRACRWLAECPRCSARLVVHLRDRKLACHYCGHQRRIPATCPTCGNQDLTPVGQGTQRVESFLESHFPGARVLRVDRDSTGRRRAWESMRASISEQRVDILVGTQMLAKGHDFPRLTMVGVLNSDAALFSTDFRASERLFSQLMQVAGRAGRRALPGEVLIQTEFPDHPLYQAVVAQDYDGHAHTLLAERRAAGFPPFSHQALLRAEAAKMEAALDFLKRAATLARRMDSQVLVYDPVPAPKARLAGVERGQLLVQSPARSRLQAFLDSWYQHLGALAGRRIRWSLDVDPVDL